jgi:hypothetical protein
MMKKSELLRGIFGNRTQDFHLHEYESLRRELEIVIQEHRALERNVLVAIGITWGWLYSISKPTPAWTFFIPFLFAILGSIRAYGMNKAYDKFHGYLCEIEEAFSQDGAPTGWEHCIERTKRGTQESLGQLLFWGILLVSTLTIAILRSCHRV